MRKTRLKNVWKNLCKKADRVGACHLVLLDPDKESPEELSHRALLCEGAGVDGLLIGGSTVEKNIFQKAAQSIYESVKIPVILFPGAFTQVTPYSDAILFMSLISGRNPDFLIGQQVEGAPLVKKYGLESIPTGYILIDSGNSTSVQRVSKTTPLSRNAVTSAVAHALAAQYFGMQTVYLEAGSGARTTVPEKMIKQISIKTDIRIIVGGGIRTPEETRNKVKAGADFIVTGTVFEEKNNPKLLEQIQKATRK
jgi:putative glycerol-1-phosphate prenyltransferase